MVGGNASGIGNGNGDDKKGTRSKPVKTKTVLGWSTTG